MSERITRAELIRRYCETQDATPADVSRVLDGLVYLFNPTGFMLLRCEMFGSSRFGQHVILPFGGSATFKEPPTHPVSPRGLASDMSVVVAVSD